MRTLLVDNGSTLTTKLARLAPGAEEICSYQAIPTDVTPFQLIILSGSSILPVLGNEDHFAAELELIRTTDIPLVGICLGHELIAVALGGTLKPHTPEKGITEITVVRDHPIFQGEQKFRVYENHQYRVYSPGPELEILATTTQGIAIVSHKTRPLYGFQFHPEHCTEETRGDELFIRLFTLLTTP